VQLEREYATLDEQISTLKETIKNLEAEKKAFDDQVQEAKVRSCFIKEP
jgi:chromosome segregation ATPase